MGMASAQVYNQFIGYVRKGEVELARKLLSCHTIDLNKVIPQRRSPRGIATLTPLMLACQHGHLKMMELLNKEGADVDFLTTSSSSARSALMLAVEERKLDVVKALIRLGAQVMERALTIACERGDLEIVKALLPKGPKSAKLSEAKWSDFFFNPFERPYGEICSKTCVMSPVSIAVRDEHLELLTWLLKGGTDVPTNCLHFAISKRNNSIVKLLLEHVATANETGNEVSALMVACRYGDIEIIKILLSQKGANVNHKNITGDFALWIAAREGHTEVVKLLIKEGANVNLTDILQDRVDNPNMPEIRNPIFEILIETCAEKPMEKPLEKPSEKCYDWHAILIAAIRRGIVRVVKLLLFKKKDDLIINEQNSSGAYPLMIAASESGSTEIIEALLKAGARTDLPDNEGMSPLMVATTAPIAKLFLDKKTIDQQDNSGRSALLHAVERRNCEIIELLLEEGAKYDLPDNDGRSVLSILQNENAEGWDYTIQV